MKAIVFGGSGFLGSHVADALTERGFSVTIYDRNPSAYRRDTQKMIIGDILDVKSVSTAIQGNAYVYNFAGIADIKEACTDPRKTVEVNILGSTNILEACRLHQVKRYIFASSIYVYSDIAPFYRSSKQSCEFITEDYYNLFGLDYTILRYGSLYGKRANQFNFIYRTIQEAIVTGKITRKGDGEEIRDYINVLDAARCSVDILSEEYKNQYVLLTGAQSVKVKDLLIMIQEIFQGKIKIEYHSESDKDHYEITPYAFRPRPAKKIALKEYYDLGQGILDVIYEVYSNSADATKELSFLKKIFDTP